MFNKPMRKLIKDQSGMALATALILMILATFIVVPGLWATGNMIKTNQDLENDTKAYYAAKSGIEDVYWRLGNNEMGARVLTGQGYKLDNQVNNMDVWVKQEGMPDVTGSETTYRISSTAKVGSNSLRTVYAKVTVDMISGYPFKYAIASTAGPITMTNGDVKITSQPIGHKADLWANGDLDLGHANSLDIEGTGYYTGSASSCEQFEGGCVLETTAAFQPIDLTGYYWPHAQSDGTPWPSTPACWNPCTTIPTVYGNTTYSPKGGLSKTAPTVIGQGSTTYIDGNLNLAEIKEGNNKFAYFQVRGVVWVNGQINIGAATYLDAYQNQQCYLLAHGDPTHGITFAKTSSVIAANNNLNLLSDNGSIMVDTNVGGVTSQAAANLGVVYAPNGAITLNSNTAVKGAVLGKSVSLGANVTLVYDEDLQTEQFEGFKINSVGVRLDEFGG